MVNEDHEMTLHFDNEDYRLEFRKGKNPMLILRKGNRKVGYYDCKPVMKHLRTAVQNMDYESDLCDSLDVIYPKKNKNSVNENVSSKEFKLFGDHSIKIK